MTRKILILILAFSGVAGAVQRTDDFQRADGRLGAGWVSTLSYPLALQNGGVYGVSGSEGDAVWQGDSIGSDQFSEILLRTWDTGWIGAWVRRIGDTQGYLVIYYSGYVNLYARNNSGWNFLTNVTQPAKAGDKLKLIATGSNPVQLDVYQNGRQIISYSDSSFHFSGGQPGLAEYSPRFGSVESWVGGDGDGTGAAHPTPPAPWRVLSGGMSVRNLRVIDGVTYLDVISDYNGGNELPTIRYIEPTNPAPDKAHRLLYVLPVEASVPGTNWGDGVNEVVSHNLHNQYNLTVVAPAFITDPWEADDATDDTRRHESFMVVDFAPWVKLNFSQTGTEKSELLSFSKGAFGGLGLIMRHPGTFDIGAFWDFPADWTYAEISDPYGTQQNFDTNYALTSTFLAAHAAPFQFSNRLWISGDPVIFQSMVQDFAARLDSAGIPYLYSNTGIEMEHRWDSGWVPRAIAALDGLPLATGSCTTTGSSTSSSSTKIVY
jgi:hypothetical protein